MAWPDVFASMGPISFSSEESKRFGLSVARMSVGSSWRKDYSSIESLYEALAGAISDSREDVVIVRVPSDLAQIGTNAVPPGRLAIAAGTLLYWSTPLAGGGDLNLPAGFTVERIPSADAQEQSIQEMSEALLDSFEGYSSHYSANRLLDPDRVADGYREWAQRTIRTQSGTAYLLRNGLDVVAAAIVQADKVSLVSEVQLAGVTSRYQGRALYSPLFQAMLAGEAGDDQQLLVISTQSHNIRVQRLWAELGLKPAASVETFHFVKSGLFAASTATWPSR